MPRYIHAMHSAPHAGLALFFMAAALACGKGEPAMPRVPPAREAGPRPDEMPVLLNSELPFRYPALLYTRKAQGNVTLSLLIDRDGRVLVDSIRVDETSGFLALDSAAVRGARALHFIPAKLHGEAIPISILFPVFFRHPDAAPLPGDTILRGANKGSDDV
jgi:TonB family protein